MVGFIGLTRESFDKLDQALGEIDNLGPYVAAWLDAHPEATTTVQDNSVTFAKLASDAHYMTTEEVLALYE